MSKKLTELDETTEVENEAWLYIAQEDSQWKASKETFLSASTDEDLALVGLLGQQFSIGADGSITWGIPTIGTSELVDNEGNLFTILAADVAWNGIGGAGCSLSWAIAGVTLEFTSSGDVHFSAAPGHDMNITYVASSPGDWAGSPATDREAIDRLASAVAGLLGTPIP
jgi:hypothetical protein